LLKDRKEDDLVLVLLSGGASSLMEKLPEGISLQDVQKLTDELIKCGAGIHEINAVRKHISKLKGGGMAEAASPANIYTLILSDVVGDNIDVIASGPTTACHSTRADALAIINKYNLVQRLTPALQSFFKDGEKQNVTTCTGTHEKSFPTIIGSNTIALQAAVHKAASLGYITRLLKTDAVDDTEMLGRAIVRYSRHYTGKLPACFLIGGETSLVVKHPGKGGRNQHFVLCALEAILATPGVKNNKLTILSAGTDGSDGPTDATGAVICEDDFVAIPGILQEAQESLSSFNSYSFFQKHGGLIITGPTQTNVMDVMIVLIDSE
jgi:hydroxypyruvate reductase